MPAPRVPSPFSPLKPPRTALAVAGATLLLVAGHWLVRAAPTHQAEPPAETSSRLSVEVLGMASYDTGYTFDGTEVGGLSGITYDPDADRFYVLSDARSGADAPRYYTVAVDFYEGEVTFQGVTTLRDAGGTAFPDGSTDPEDIALSATGTLFVSSEGDVDGGVAPFIGEFALDGTQLRTLTLPDHFLPSGDGARGIRDNLAFEPLAVTTDGSGLWSGTENALVQDGPIASLTEASPARLIRFDVASGLREREHVYVVEPIPVPPQPPGSFADNGLVALLALDDAGTLLALERSYAVGVGNTIRLFEARTASALDVSDYEALPTTGPRAHEVLEGRVRKRLLADFGALGLRPDNVEGMTFGPTLPDGRMTLVAVSDNNFNPAQTTQFIAMALTFGPPPVHLPYGARME